MKAAQVKEYGGVEKIAVEAVGEPGLKEGQVLVQVRAASLNPFDTILRSGVMQEMIPLHLPFTLGGDFAGVVTGLSEGVTNFTIGDEVYGSANVANGGSGSLAELVAVNVANTALRPTKIDFIQTAALPLAGVSALQAIDEHIKLKDGHKILIHGGAGGIGSYAVQVAKARGAYVAATVAYESVDFVKSLGADLAIDYQTEDFTKVVKDYDSVFDTVGGAVTMRSIGVIRAGGVLVTMAGQVDETAAGEGHVTAIRQSTKVSTAWLEKLRDLVESGLVKPQIDKTFFLSEAQEAYKLLEQGHPRGKIVVKIG